MDSQSNPTPQIEDIYFVFVDSIDVAKVNLFMSIIVQAVLPHSPKRLHVLISSPGGDVSAGIALYNYLRALPIEVLTYNIGMVASIANVIFMAADAKNRFACPHTSFLFHGVKAGLGPVQMDLAQVRELESNLKRDQERISEVYQQGTSLTEEKIEELFKQGEIRDLNSAVQDGIIDSVKRLQLPQNAHQIVFAVNLSYVRPG